MTTRNPQASGIDWSDTSSTSSRVVIGVLTWNGYEKARACLESLTLLRSWPLPVVVVDNGSREREGDRLAEEFGSLVEALTLPINRAVAGGYNAALQWAADRDATHVLLLNNDTLITDPQMVDRLTDALGPDIAAVGPVIRNRDGSTYSAGGLFSWLTGRSSHRRRPALSDGPYPAPWLDGPCVLISLEAVRRVGELDPIFVSYWEDVDWCTRAVRAGYQCLVEPRTSIVHLRGGTIPSIEAEAYDLRNGILFMRRHGSAFNNATALAFMLLVRAPVRIAKRVRSATRLRSFLRAARGAVGWNVRDARRRGSWRVPVTEAVAVDGRLHEGER